MKCQLILLAVSGLVIFLILAFAPLNYDISVQSFTPKSVPEFTGALTKNEKLNAADRLFQNKIAGPESLAMGKDGLYSGLPDGRIVRLHPDTGAVETVVRIGGNNCDADDSKTKCGFPAGVRFDADGYLYACDGIKGLHKVNVATGEVITLVDSSKLIDGKKLKFANDLTISKAGDIYFTDFGVPSLDVFVLTTIEHAPTGRVLHYDPVSKKARILIDNLLHTNGIELTPEEDALLVAISYESSIIKYYLKGPKKGQVEMFADNLPGYLDNIRLSPRNTYWVSFFMAKQPGFTSLKEMLGPYPITRKVIFRALFYTSGILKCLQKIAGIGQLFGILEYHVSSFIDKSLFDWNYGLIVELNQEGQIIRSLHSPDGATKGISQALEHDNTLYFGSPWNLYVGRLKL